MRLVWFVIAGFVLGFSVSTLWEWFYFRGRRLAQAEPQPASEPQTQNHTFVKERYETGQPATVDSGTGWQPARSAGGDSGNGELDDGIDEPAEDGSSTWQSYQGPGVFLESEDEDVEPFEDSPPAEQPDERPVEREAAPQTPRRPSPVTPPATPRVTPSVARSTRPTTPDIYRLEPVDDAEAENAPHTLFATPTNQNDSSHSEFQRRESRPAVAPEVARKVEPQSVPKSPARGAKPVRKSNNYPDDLAKIKGIGEVYKQRLYAARIYTWHQITQTDEETLRDATQAYPSSNVDEWAEQAEKLTEKHGRVGAVYTGPPPSDLTRIYGIGPVGAATLYRAGICTYAQLAEETPQSLAPLFPIAVAGDEPDFAHWIEQARELAD
jgi:predicted flap endonuclease-1-like 5' DNA nuclease